MIIRRRHILPFILGLGGLIYSIITVPGCDRLVTDHHVDTIVGHPSANFVIDTSFGCPPLTVNFTDSTIGDHDVWTWYFGDGDSSSQTNPVHEYTVPGVYTVILKVNNTPTSGTDTEVKNHLITVGTSVAGIILSDTSGCAGLEVSVRPGTYGAVDSFIWDFGDSSTPVIQFNDSIVSHTYDTSGSYNITLTAAGPCDTVVLNGPNPIVVGNCPIVGLESDDSAGCKPLDVIFSDLSTLVGQDSIIGWHWEFGDGDTSADTNPSHTYTFAGEYTVTLTVTASDSSTATDSMAVPITVYDSVSADFASLASQTGCFSIYQDFKVKFVNQSTGKVDSVKWYFGDGDSSTVLEPVHAYSAVGSYDVTLIVDGPCRSDTISKSSFVKLTDSLTSVTVAAVPDPQKDSTWLFTGSASGTVFEWLWEFADDRTLIAQFGAMAFDSSGSYPVTLTASNDCNEVRFDTIIDIVLGP